jgi:hypothetical protein
VAAVRAVKPYPWVRTVPAGVDAAGFPDAKGRGTGDRTGTTDASGDGRIVVADLVWERFYALPRRDVDQRADGLLEARTAHGRRLLASLVEVTAGTDQTGADQVRAGPAGADQAGAVRWESPAVAGGEAVRRPT